MQVNYYLLGTLDELIGTKNPIYYTGKVVESYEVLIYSSNYNNCHGAEDIEEINMINYRDLSLRIPSQSEGEIVHRSNNFSLTLEGQSVYLGVSSDWG